MSILKIEVLLVVSLFLLMQMNLVLAQKNKSISLKISKSHSNALSYGPDQFPILGELSFLSVPILLAGQTFNVLLDLGKSDLWVVDATCRNAYCISRSRLAPVDWVNTKQRVSLSYVFNRWQVSGLTAKASFALVGPPATQIPGFQDFIRVSSTNGFTVTNEYDGLMGLAPRRTIRNHASVIDNMFELDIISTKTFSIHTRGLFLNIGDVPDTIRRPIRYMKVVTRGIWDFRANSVSLNDGVGGDVTTIANNPYFRIETLVSGFGVPRNALKAIAKDLGATLAAGVYTVPCGTTKNLDLIINGQLYRFPPTNYIIGISPPAASCRLNLIETNIWIVGQAFFYLFDAVFNADSNLIGFSNS